MKKKAVIVDLDGTLCNNDHRQHHLEKQPKDWDSFFSEELKDTPNKWCDHLVRTISEDFQILFVTGRKIAPHYEESRTLQWLKEHGYMDLKNSPILLARKHDDFRKDYVVKEELYREIIEPEWEILFAIDDRQQVVDMWRRIGLPCLQCADHQF